MDPQLLRFSNYSIIVSSSYSSEHFAIDVQRVIIGWSDQPRCYITASDNQIRLFCFILDYSEDSFSVKLKTDKMVEDLRDEIIRKAGLTNKTN